MKVLYVFVLALLLSACDQAPENQAEETAGAAPGVMSAEDLAVVEEAEEEAAMYAGEEADESADCGDIAWLLDHLPTSEELGGISRSYIGCESRVTAMVVFEEENRSIMASFTVLSPGLAGISGDAVNQWQAMLEQTRNAVMKEISEQLPWTQVDEDEREPVFPLLISLTEERDAILFLDEGSWEVLGMLDEDVAVKLRLDDDSVVTAEQAREVMMPVMESLKLPLQPPAA